MALGQFHLIPKQAFLFFPKDEEIVQIRNKGPYRIIFDGGVQYTNYQNEKLSELHRTIKKQVEDQHLEFMHEPTLMRFLQATKYDIQNCIEQLQKYKKWEDSILPLILRPDIQKLLKKGLFYMIGRDVKYRPVIVVNVARIIQADLKQKTFFQAMGYYFQFIVQNCLIPGQIETWITIVDLGKLGLFSLGGTVIDTIKFLSNHFRCRLHRNYLVNCPGSMTFLFGMVKKAMTQDQLMKISLTEDSSLPKEAFKELFEDEIQKKYGGSHRNLVDFWPYQPEKRKPNQYQKSRLISVNQYGQKHEKGLLIKTKVNKIILKQYLDLKNIEIQRSQMKNNLRINDINLKICELQEQDDQEEASWQQVPQIHIIPQPFQIKQLFDFQSPNLRSTGGCLS